MTYSMISHNFNIIRLTARTNTAIPKFCHCCNDKAITAHIMKIALTRTACFFNSGWKFPPKTQKKQQWLFQSLLLKISVSYRNRTYNRVLGVRVTLVPTCHLMSTNVSIYQESRHLIGNPCQYKLTDIIPFLIFSVSSLLEMLTYGIN